MALSISYGSAGSVQATLEARARLASFLNMIQQWSPAWDRFFIFVGPWEDPPLPDVIAPTPVSQNEIGLPLRSATSAVAAWITVVDFLGNPSDIPRGLPANKHIDVVKGLIQTMLDRVDARLSSSGGTSPKKSRKGLFIAGAIAVAVLGIAAVRH